ncbi:hypothetical protein EELLY_v1c05790 [Entomoplasma ellychniae]|uniref:RamC N-terminal domain-containing protein n=1 Tax=Entomoplasma ellychniae TaxID=2114 RepID=A0A8E2QZ78_9MOLU|nr:hypothetical protein [Entomoplasma ellychniae]PPE04898.1 hypothetical protein EELLY_v1c05790 [Entomoplasma ellychniae]
MKTHSYEKILNKFNINYTEDLFYFKSCCIDDKKNIIMGWKIHISSDILSSNYLCETIIRYCKINSLNFKILKNSEILLNSLSKKSRQEQLGKFITIYFNSKKSFINNIENIYILIDSKKANGPYIYTDKRYKDSKVIYYRFGAIYPRILLNEFGDPYFYYKKNKILLNSENYYKVFEKDKKLLMSCF